MSKTPDCQLCESGVKTFREEYPEVPADYPKFHVVGQGITSYSVPCNALERAKMRAINERLAAADHKRSALICTWCTRKPVVPPMRICADCLDATRPPDGDACSGMGDPKPESTELSGPRDEVLNELTQEAQKLGLYDAPPAGGKCQADVPIQGGDTRRCWNPLPCAAHPCPHPNPTGFVGPCRACGDE